MTYGNWPSQSCWLNCYYTSTLWMIFVLKSSTEGQTYFLINNGSAAKVQFSHVWIRIWSSQNFLDLLTCIYFQQIVRQYSTFVTWQLTFRKFVERTNVTYVLHGIGGWRLAKIVLQAYFVFWSTFIHHKSRIIFKQCRANQTANGVN